MKKHLTWALVFTLMAGFVGYTTFAPALAASTKQFTLRPSSRWTPGATGTQDGASVYVGANNRSLMVQVDHTTAATGTVESKLQGRINATGTWSDLATSSYFCPGITKVGAAVHAEIVVYPGPIPPYIRYHSDGTDTPDHTYSINAVGIE